MPDVTNFMNTGGVAHIMLLRYVTELLYIGERPEEGIHPQYETQLLTRVLVVEGLVMIM